MSIDSTIDDPGRNCIAGFNRRIPPQQPELPDTILRRWQEIVDMAALLTNVPAALIMRVQKGKIEVLVSSRTKGNPYAAGAAEEYHDHCGLYCEHVIRNNARLLVPDAREDEAWIDNPDIPLGMISYLGLPIMQPDGTPFGTICILDTQGNPYSPEIDRLMHQFKHSIEDSLALSLENIALQQAQEEAEKAKKHLREARNNLAGIVAERTSELLMSNLCLKKEVREHERTEQELRRRASVNESHARIVHALIEPGSTMRSIAETALECALDITGSEYGSAVSIAEENPDMILHASPNSIDPGSCTNCETEQLPYRGADGYIGPTEYSLNMGKGFYTASPTDHPAFSGLPAEKRPERGFMTVPAMFNEKPVGCITLAEPKKPYTQDDLDAVRTLADLFALVLNRARTQEALVRSMEKAEEANRIKSRFLANMSHEIRTPLNGIMGMMQLMQETPLDDEQQEYINASLNSCRRLTNILGDTLDLAVMEAGRLVLHEDWFNVQDQILDTMDDLFRHEALRQGLDFTVLADDIPELVCGDASRLRQILFNLVGNALKFTTSGGIEIHVHTQSSTQGRQCRLLFSVRDTGIGIPDEFVDDMFAPFAQAEDAYTRRYQGAGLGLSIFKQVLGIMGGNASVTDNEDGGTTFFVSIPFRLPSETDHTIQGIAGYDPAASRKLRILVADDDPINRTAVTRMLEKEGCEISSVKDGTEVLSTLAEKSFDLIFMDIQMPELNGIDTLKRIRNAPEFAHTAKIPVIAVTAFALSGDRDAFLQMGMNGYLAKPVDRIDLVRSMHEAGIRAGTA